MRGGRLFNRRAIGEAAAYALLAIAVVGAAIVLAVGYARTHPRSIGAPEPADARTSELLRCQALGFAAERDAACRSAWAKGRHDFLTYQTSRRSVASTSYSNPSFEDE